LLAVDQLLLQLKSCKSLASHIQQHHEDPDWATAGAEITAACRKYEAFVEGNRALAAKLQRTEVRLAAAAAAAASTSPGHDAAEDFPSSVEALEEDPQRLLHLCRLLIRSLSHSLPVDALEWLAALEATDKNAQQLAQLQRLEQELVAAIDNCVRDPGTLCLSSPHTFLRRAASCPEVHANLLVCAHSLLQVYLCHACGMCL
jgi:Zn-dependent oligopeptidase